MLKRFSTCAQEGHGWLHALNCAEPGMWWLVFLAPALSLVWNAYRIVLWLWRRWRSYISRRVRNHWLKQAASTGFAIDGLRADVHVHEFVAGAGYDPGNIVIRLIDRQPHPIPEDLQRAYERRSGFWNTKLENNEIYEGPRKLAARRIRTTREGIHEQPRLVIDTSWSSYVHHRACSDVFRLDLEPSRRAGLILSPNTCDWPSNSLGLLLAVVTGDGKLVFVSRSGETAVNQGRLLCSLAEALSEEDMRPRFDAKKAVLRAIDEELGISPRRSRALDWSINGILFNQEHYEWNLFGVVMLAEEYDSQQILEYFHGAKMKDRWETGGCVELVDFEEKAVARYLKENAARLTNYSLVVAVMAVMAKLDAGLFRRHLRQLK